MVLSTSEPNGLCYIETAELDGQVFERPLTIANKIESSTVNLTCFVTF